MQPDHGRLAARWMAWANEDLLVAEAVAGDPGLVARAACVFAHQAAEKAVKALLASHGVDPPKLHDLDRLVARLPDVEDRRFGDVDLPELTRWAIEGRYPDDMDEAGPADAARAVALARSVVSIATSLLQT